METRSLKDLKIQNLSKSSTPWTKIKRKLIAI